MMLVPQADLELNKSSIAVAISPGVFGGHLGVVFESANEGRKLLHLEFHLVLRTAPFPPKVLRDSAVPVDASAHIASAIRQASGNAGHEAAQIPVEQQQPKSCWLASIVDLPEQVSKVVVGVARAVSKKGSKIHFGTDFIAAKGSFDAAGSYKAPRGSQGLTCASFVNELFYAAGISLVRPETWEELEGFEAWKKGVIKLLKLKGAEQGHIEAVANSKSKLRLRPEELAGAAASPNSERPMSFAQAQRVAAKVVEQIEASCPFQMQQMRRWAEVNLGQSSGNSTNE
jgi:hypothetical protein